MIFAGRTVESLRSDAASVRGVHVLRQTLPSENSIKAVEAPQ